MQLTASQLLTAEGPVQNPVIEVDGDGLIRSITPGGAASDATTLTPAFLDVHCHGAANHDVMEATPAALSAVGKYLATRGVAHYLPSTVTAPNEVLLRSLEGLAKIVEGETPRDEARPIGIHLEGPFISHAKKGMHPAAEIKAPSIELFDRFQQAANGNIKLVTIAPEGDTPDHHVQAVSLIRHCATRGVKVSIGHSNATSAQALAAIAAGAASTTHAFNAMRPLDHREPGILGVVLDHPTLFAELICDGVHVESPLIRLWLKAMSSAGTLDCARGILITDSISATGMSPGEYALGGVPVTVTHDRVFLSDDPNGGATTLAGSILTLDKAVANFVEFTKVPLASAIRAVTANPAAMLGRPELVGLKAGSPANFNRYNSSGKLQETILHGKTVSR